MSTVIIHDFVPYVPPAFIPTPTEEDNGKYVGVSEGIYDLSYVNAMPTPKTPTNTNGVLGGITTNLQNKQFVAEVLDYQISVKGNSASEFAVQTQRTAKNADIMNFFNKSATDTLPMAGNITMLLFNYKPDGSGANGTNRLKMSHYFSNTVGDKYVDMYFPYKSYYNETMYKGVFIIHCTADAYTVSYISEN